MRIMIVDDDANKIRQLSDFVQKEFPNEILDERRSYQSGLKSIILDPPDIVILDMTMPTYDVGGKETGGRERRYAGRQILQQLKRKKILTRVVVVTQFERFGEGSNLITLEELKKDLATSFSENHVDTIYYQAADSRWRIDLKNAIDKEIAHTGIKPHD